MLLHYWECKFYALIERLCFLILQIFPHSQPTTSSCIRFKNFCNYLSCSSFTEKHISCEVWHVFYHGSEQSVSNAFIFAIYRNLTEACLWMGFNIFCQQFWIKFSATLLFKGYLLIVFRVINGGSQGIYFEQFFACRRTSHVPNVNG